MPTNPNSRTIQILLLDGDPRGLRQAEFTRGTVRVIEFPKPSLLEFLKQEESNYLGIYLLFESYAKEKASPMLYIGQTGDFKQRLRAHEKEKDFWDRVVVITTKDDSFDLTHIAYLEWKAIIEAKKAGRYSLDNGNDGRRPHMRQFQEADCIQYFEDTRILLGTLGHPVFEPIRKAIEQPGEESIFECKAVGTDGRGIFTQDDGFVVLKDSVGRLESVPSMKGTGDDEFRHALIADNVVRVEGDKIVFNKDHLMNSITQAAIALLGSSVNGWFVWKTADGRTADEVKRRARLNTPAAEI